MVAGVFEAFDLAFRKTKTETVRMQVLHEPGAADPEHIYFHRGGWPEFETEEVDCLYTSMVLSTKGLACLRKHRQELYHRQTASIYLKVGMTKAEEVGVLLDGCATLTLRTALFPGRLSVFFPSSFLLFLSTICSCLGSSLLYFQRRELFCPYFVFIDSSFGTSYSTPSTVTVFLFTSEAGRSVAFT